MIRNIRKVIPIVGLMWVTTFAFAQSSYDASELKDFLAVAQGQCEHRGQMYVCFLLQKEKEYRIVTVDAQGALSVNKVKELKDKYLPHEVEILWERNPERRQGLRT